MPLKNTLTLRQRVLQSGSWTLLGYGVNQVLRLGGNLILTRLLFPEAFGMMAIIQVVMYGAAMLTDFGIGTSVVQKDRGNAPSFLNTAWTVQILRSILIWAGLCVLAFPLAKLYGEPLLAGMLPVVGFAGVISGFNSTKLYTAQRNLEAARVTQIEVGTYALGLLCTVYLAWLLQSVWALVWGSVITSFLKMTASHIFLHGIRNQFEWNRDALDHLIVFGRWIMLNSFLTFLSAEGSRLLLGALLDMRQLALFTLASTMSLMLWQAILQLAWRVFFPAYSEVYRGNPKNLMSVLFKSRLAIILPSWCLAVLFVFFGVQVMETLYDERYHGSGAMLELLAAGTLVGCVWGSYVGILLAMGKVATSTMLIAIQIVCQIGAMLFGYYYWGGAGIVFGVAAANWIMYPVHALVMSKNGLWQPKLDLMMLAASVVIVMLAWPNFTASGYGLDL
ncbi:MAG: oligosaccharide flippase family protein [Pseudomonadota bacterium]